MNITTGEVRLSYVHLTAPYSYNEGQEAKYSTTILVPKTDKATIEAISNAIEDAKQKGAVEKWGGTIPPKVATPMHDGDGTRPSDGMPFGDECKGHYVFTASSKQKPQIVDGNLQEILDATAIYSGMYARVNVTFFPYNSNGKKGIGVGLGPVQKLRDGEVLGGAAPKASDVFTAVAPSTNEAFPF